MANGFLRVQGQQINIPSGNLNDGPFMIPYSTIADIVIVPINATTVTAVPATSAGVIIIPNTSVTGETITAGFISGQLTGISPTYPTIWSFNPAAIPSNVYVTISNTAGATVTLRFF